MSILDQKPVDSAQQAADAITNIIQQQNNLLNNALVMAYNLLWNNPNAAPQAILDKIGTNATQVFQLSNLNIITLNSVASLTGITPPAITGMPSGWTATYNLDGTITLSKA